jgi:hypothetical protein
LRFSIIYLLCSWVILGGNIATYHNDLYWIVGFMVYFSLFAKYSILGFMESQVCVWEWQMVCFQLKIGLNCLFTLQMNYYIDACEHNSISHSVRQIINHFYSHKPHTRERIQCQLIIEMNWKIQMSTQTRVCDVIHG